jgi:hypothetical protein
MSEDQHRAAAPAPGREDETSVADLIGDDIAVGHGGLPTVWIVAVVLVVVWATLTWVPWKGY